MTKRVDTPTLDYAVIYQTKLQENIDEILINPESILEKVTNFAVRYGYTIEEVYRKIREPDRMFACTQAKDPVKQNMFEKAAAKFIADLPSVERFEKLPSHGDVALYLSHGSIYTGEQRRLLSLKDYTKSIDFAWWMGTSAFFATHKYTKSGGGGQDHQYNDVKTFLSHAVYLDNYEGHPVYLIAICDGAYYTERKMATLRKIAVSHNIFVVRINDLPTLLNDLRELEQEGD